MVDVPISKLDLHLINDSDHSLHSQKGEKPIWVFAIKEKYTTHIWFQCASKAKWKIGKEQLKQESRNSENSKKRKSYTIYNPRTGLPVELQG